MTTDCQSQSQDQGPRPSRPRPRTDLVTWLTWSRLETRITIFSITPYVMLGTPQMNPHLHLCDVITISKQM